ncbi:MAG: hypothetical protein Kow0069_25280 [Promethearchaeota archaeon]
MDVELEFTAAGRNVIPRVGPGAIVQVHGQNGVGKSMAATLLEIATGNYVFPDLEAFKRFKGAVSRCQIVLSVATDRGPVRYFVFLEPDAWTFDSAVNKVHPLTLGKVHRDGEEISFEEFFKQVHVVTIRGNENLERQVEFVEGVFASKIQQKLSEMDEAIDLWNQYRQFFVEEANCAELEELEGLNQQLQDEVSLIDQTDRWLQTRSGKKEKLEKTIDLLGMLERFSAVDVEAKKKQLRGKKEESERLKKTFEEEFKKRTRIEERLRESRKELNEETRQALEAIDGERRKIEKLLKRVREVFEADQAAKVEKSVTEANVRELEMQVKAQEEELSRVKEEFERLNEEHERVVKINGIISRIEEACRGGCQEGLGREVIFELDLGALGSGEGKAKVTLAKLAEMARSGKRELEKSEELKTYKRRVQQLNEELNASRDRKGLVEKVLKARKKIKEQERRLALSGRNAASLDFRTYQDRIAGHEQTLAEVEKKLKELEDKRKRVEGEIHELEKSLAELEKLPAIEKMLDGLKELGVEFAGVPSLEEVRERAEKVEEELRVFEAEFKKYEQKRKVGRAKVEDLRKKIAEKSQKAKDCMRKFGFSELGGWVEYARNHAGRLEKFISALKKAKKHLQALADALGKIVRGEKVRDGGLEGLLVEAFDGIFREIYGGESFFRHVFKGYDRIEKFDLGRKEIVFVTHDDRKERRKLSEFSSGEKTYAYCRAIIEMVADPDRVVIVVLDESYALLDYEHSEDLYEFQKQMVRAGRIKKFVNILPLKEVLDERVEELESRLEKERRLGDEAAAGALSKALEEYRDYAKQVRERGYYQRVVPL